MSELPITTCFSKSQWLWILPAERRRRKNHWRRRRRRRSSQITELIRKAAVNDVSISDFVFNSALSANLLISIGS